MNNKLTLNTLSRLFNFTTRGISNWKRERRPIIVLLEKYFSEKDLVQFLNKEKIDSIDYLLDCKNVVDFIHKDVYEYCLYIREKPEIQIYGKFLDSIKDQRMEKTWLDFNEFSKTEAELWKWIEKEYSLYLINNNLDVISHLIVISDIYKKYPVSYRYYFIKSYMWMFMPTTLDLKLSQIKQIYNSLPSYIQSIPGIKSMIKTFGMFGFLGFFQKKE